MKSTDRKILELKFKKGYSTIELIRRFPKRARKVSEIALLQVPTPLLRKLITEADLPERILHLKQKLFGRKR